MFDIPTYITVIKGKYEGARGYIFPNGSTPHLAYCHLYNGSEEHRVKLKLELFTIIEPRKECAVE